MCDTTRRKTLPGIIDTLYDPLITDVTVKRLKEDFQRQLKNISIS